MRGRGSCVIRFGIFLFSAVAALFLWTAEAERDAHYTPEYARIDLKPLLEKAELSEEDYGTLFRQTGLGRPGVEELYREGRKEELLYLQQRFFAPIEYECKPSNPFCRGERITREDELQGNFMPTVRTGDILVTFNSHFFGWRSGHAGLVTDGETGQVLEAFAIGQNSGFCNLEHWKEYPGFVLLRLKDSSPEETERIADYAAEHLADIPYDLASFTDGNGETDSEPLSSTQCAHLVWTAYAHFGYDLESNGGFVVTPADLYQSDLLEVVQIYGINY